MKEYMILVRNTADSKNDFSPEQDREFLDKCKVYIEWLTKEGKLISAQPMVREGRMIAGKEGAWKESNYKEGDEVIVGYYHILANDLEDAINIAKGNPEFAYTDTARTEVRPIKMKEEVTGFIYPNAG